MHSILLNLLLLHLPLQITRQVILFLRSWHKPRRMREHIVHLLKRHLLGLRQQEVKEQRIGKVANHKQIVIPILDIFHGDGGNLTDHRVERERDTSRDRDTLRASACVKHLRGDNPRQRTAGRGEGEVVQPGHDDETPVGAAVDGGGRELGEQDGGDDEGHAVAEVAAD